MNYIEEKVGEFRGFLTPSSQKEHEQITKLCEYFKTTLQEVDRRAREEGYKKGDCDGYGRCLDYYGLSAGQEGHSTNLTPQL